MKIRKPLPSNRSYDQVLNHYLIEKALATKLKAADKKMAELVKNENGEYSEK